jgi:hypothetical protein
VVRRVARDDGSDDGAGGSSRVTGLFAVHGDERVT